jgi:predicted outer membrane lipoprotein
MFPTWLLGVLLAIAASIVSNLGLNLQVSNTVR